LEKLDIFPYISSLCFYCFKNPYWWIMIYSIFTSHYSLF
jgi:hypothetical protein